MISRRTQHEVRNHSNQDKQSTARINDERGLGKVGWEKYTTLSASIVMYKVEYTKWSTQGGVNKPKAPEKNDNKEQQ